MSDTPETDAQDQRPIRVVIKRLDGTTVHYVPADFARKLERERNEARHLLERKWQGENPPLIKMMQERDEARRLLAAARESLNAIHVEVGGWIAEMMKEEK